jgi:hypothetical protein
MAKIKWYYNKPTIGRAQHSKLSNMNLTKSVKMLIQVLDG